MDDLISRQAAIDAIEKMNIPEDMCVFEILSHIEVEIATLPTIQPEPQWIPVSERLPEEPGYYITSNEYNGVGEDFYYDGHFYNADKNAYEVLAWMPKPEHYKPNNE